MELINQKPLKEIKEEKEMEKILIQADTFEVIAMLYEEMEGLRSRIEQLEGGVE